ncbi:MAG: beta-1,6-N-acetylglucosaminyltransferase [Lachnospiraceae bacterium]|nr:beta-1,6-N-acetylglucosaminyltransferase [Lachnospiraceae bacterium]
MKQAFLITAYKDFASLYELASYLSENNRVFIHVDTKSRDIKEKEIEKLNHLPDCMAISIFNIAWGSINHVNAFLELLAWALEEKDVSYFHCITGEDYPVISTEEMEERFLLDNRIYMDCFAPEELSEAVKIRYRYYNLFPNQNVKNPVLWQLQNFTVKLQKLFFIKRKGIGEFRDIYKGLVYVSMPRKAGEYVINYCKEHPKYLKDLKKCQVPEEFFFQTLFMNSHFRDQVSKGNLRYMNWEKGDGSSPAYLDMEDYDKILEGDYVFARKFHREESKALKEALIKRM